MAADEIPALVDNARHVARELGLRVTEGKKIIELRPPIDDNNGTAAVAFVQRVGALESGGSILAAGDDQTDEDIFRALKARASRAVTVHILGAARDEQIAVATEAEFVLASPIELRRALEWLVARRAR